MNADDQEYLGASSSSQQSAPEGGTWNGRAQGGEMMIGVWVELFAHACGDPVSDDFGLDNGPCR